MVIAGQLDSDSESAQSLLDFPMDIGALQDKLDEDGLENLNENVTFEEIDSINEFDGEDTTINFTPEEYEEFGDGAGQYVVMVTVTEDGTGFSASDGDLAVNGHSALVGADGLLVQSESSEVSVEDIEPGDTASFDVGTTFDGEVHHGVALYHKETFENSETIINVTEAPSTDFSSEDVIFEPEIGEVYGVADLDEDAPLIGSAIEPTSVSGTYAVTDVLSFVAGEFDQDEPTVDPGDESLDASVTTLSADGDATVDIETLEDWAEGEYQWVHVAATEDGEQIATSEGTIEIEEDSPGVIPPPPPDPPEASFEIVKTGASATELGADESVELTATVQNTGDASGTTTLEFTRDGEVIHTETVSLDAGEDKSVTVSDAPGAGTYDYAVNGESIATVTFEDDTEPPEPEPAKFVTGNAFVSDTEVETGESIDVTATIVNEGGEAGTHTAELFVDGEAVDSTTISLGPGEEETVSFTHTFDDEGEYEIAINDATIGTVTVEDDDGIPGFGPVAALLAISLTLLVARRRLD
ncbi:CARDB domain-containing protein [Halovivax gelatinilyticus]|uniref:CARDB domain-containing protein n=1 Tax=Halovivax gelatinilyticus TaxID=2961597 RepID=UPI0020CA5536|nr:CARDB domain-containing protein [Halovivax gelatinilyticus]